MAKAGTAGSGTRQKSSKGGVQKKRKAGSAARCAATSKAGGTAEGRMSSTALREALMDETPVSDIISCPPAHPIGRALQLRTAADKGALQRVRRMELPEGWKIHKCHKVLRDTRCRTLRVRVVAAQHLITIPKVGRHRIVTLHFVEPGQHVLTQAIAARGGPISFERVVAFAAAGLCPDRFMQRVLVLGVGGASVIKALYNRDRREITGVDLSGVVIDTARLAFGAPAETRFTQSVRYCTADAFEFLKGSKETYDCVVADVFTNASLSPARMRELCRLVRPRLAQNGLLVANLHSYRAELPCIMDGLGVTGKPELCGWLLPIPLDAGGGVVLAVTVSPSGMSRDWREVLRDARTRLVPPLQNVADEYLEPRRMFHGFSSQKYPVRFETTLCDAGKGRGVLVLPGWQQRHFAQKQGN